MRPFLLAAAALVAVPAAAQVPSRDSAAAPAAVPAVPRDTVATLSVEQAVALARRFNPQHLSTVNNRAVAGSELRSAYGAFLPSVTAEFGSQFREGRAQIFAGERVGAASDQIASDYSIGVQAQYGVATVVTPKLQRANVRAAEAAVVGSDQRLRTAITTQYINVLQQTARAALQDTLLATAQAQLALARARADVGAVTPLDVRRAEVAVGQQEVARLQARNQAEIEKVRLFQQMGVPQPANVQLTSAFPMTEPTFQLAELVAIGRRSNPTLEETRSRERVAQLNYRNAQAQYTPTLSVSTGVGGYTNQYTDNGYVLNQRL